MTRNKKISTAALLSLGSAVLMGGVANAQAPGTPGAPGGPGAPAGDAGTVSNQTTTETVTTSAPVITDIEETTTTTSTTLPDTGGEPILFALGGLVLVGGSLLMRRKLA